MYVRAYACLCMHACSHMCVHLYMHLNMSMSVCVCVRVGACVCVCVCVCTGAFYIESFYMMTFTLSIDFLRLSGSDQK